MNVTRLGMGLLAVIAAVLLVADGPPTRAARGVADDHRSLTLAARPAVVHSATELPYPITPPRADLITVGATDLDGYATVTGAAGAVEDSSGVLVVNLSTNNVMTATASTAGAFSARLYAPPGSSLLIKHGMGKAVLEDLWDGSRPGAAVPDISFMNPWPGTIILANPPPSGTGQTQPFRSAGSFLADVASGDKRWAGWAFSGTLQVPPGATGAGLSIEPGQRFTLTARLRVASPAMNCVGTPAYNPTAIVHLHYLFGEDGRPEPWTIWFNSHLFTPTGLPIEHEGDPVIRGLGSATFTSLTCLSNHTFEGSLSDSFEVPPDLPDGIYMVTAHLDRGSVPLYDGLPLTVIWYARGPAELAPLRVGSTDAPHIPWVLLADYPVNGYRGVQAREDVDRFAMPTRVVFPPHRVVIPRLDERTGEPLEYRLEPGAPWLSSTDRRFPCPPYLPLKLPSGELTVRVHKPDGSTDTIGPQPLRQTSVRTPTTPGGSPIAEGTGHIGDLYHLTTMDDDFSYQFDQYGQHVINLEGEVSDIYGNRYPIDSTYDVLVARVLDIDPGQLPSTPYHENDYLHPGLHLFPPVPADVTVRLVHMPYSNPGAAVTRQVTGVANRFGYFQPPASTRIRLTTPGEFRVDLTALYCASDGTLWAGAVTWGNVVEEWPQAAIEAHGRRGMDYHSDTIDDMSAWFENSNLPSQKIGIENYYPYFNGDTHWGSEDAPADEKGDSIHSIITVEDLTSSKYIYDTVRNYYPNSRGQFRWPPDDTSSAGLEKRLEVDEAPLFLATGSGIDAEAEPDDIELWGYWYGSSERPDVRVREIISEDNMGTAYWRFNDTYGYQIGEGAAGDLPGDIKWEFGGAVFRVPDDAINEYAIYSSLWVLLPHNDPVGARVTSPFQDALGTGINGGPIMTLQGRDIDMLFLPKGIRPGDVLQVGDVVSFSGHVGPPLDSRVDVTITAPDGSERSGSWHASKVGWLYDPDFDFVAHEAGRWTVDVSVTHDRPYRPTGVTPGSHNTGTVLGTTGRYEFYVVSPGAPRLPISVPQPGFVTWPTGHVQPITIRGSAPVGTTAVRYTIHDKGVVMGQGGVVPGAGGVFTITYDAPALNVVFPFLSLTSHESREREGLSDEVAINLLAVGGSEPVANTITLIGEEVFVGGVGASEMCDCYLPVVRR